MQSGCSTHIAIFRSVSTALYSTRIIFISGYSTGNGLETMNILLRLVQAVGLSLALTAAAVADEPLKIATSAGPVGQLASFAAKLAKEKGQDVKIVELSDWVALNEVVNSGDVDANLFQHATYLALQNKQRGFNLVQIDKVGVIAPVGLFSKKVKSLEEIKSAEWRTWADPARAGRPDQADAGQGILGQQVRHHRKSEEPEDCRT